MNQPVAEGRYWRDARMTRLSYRLGQAQHEVLIRDGRITSFISGPGVQGAPHHGACLEAGEFERSCDVWVNGLLAVPQLKEGEPCIKLICDAISSGRIVGCRELKDQGRSLVTVSLASEKMKTELVFDPEVNWLVRRMVCTVDGYKGPVVKEVVRFEEPVPGIYFPAESLCHFPGQEQPVQHIFRNIRLNEPIPPGAVSLPLPTETVMTDHIKGTIYTIDAQGRDLGAARDASGRVLTFNTRPPISGKRGQAEEIVFASSEESGSWSWWITTASLALLACAVCILLYRRFWPSRQSA